MVEKVLQQFVPRSRGFVTNLVGSMVKSMGLMPGVGGMTAGRLSSPPVHGVVGGGMEGLSLVCESPRVNRRSSGGGGGLMWSAEGGRQLEMWRVRIESITFSILLSWQRTCHAWLTKAHVDPQHRPVESMPTSNSRTCGPFSIDEGLPKSLESFGSLLDAVRCVPGQS